MNFSREFFMLPCKLKKYLNFCEKTEIFLNNFKNIIPSSDMENNLTLPIALQISDYNHILLG